MAKWQDSGHATVYLIILGASAASMKRAATGDGVEEQPGGRHCRQLPNAQAGRLELLCLSSLPLAQGPVYRS